MPTGALHFSSQTKGKKTHLILDLSFYLFLAIQFRSSALQLSEAQRKQPNISTHSTGDDQARATKKKRHLRPPADLARPKTDGMKNRRGCYRRRRANTAAASGDARRQKNLLWPWEYRSETTPKASTLPVHRKERRRQQLMRLPLRDGNRAAKTPPRRCRLLRRRCPATARPPPGTPPSRRAQARQSPRRTGRRGRTRPTTSQQTRTTARSTTSGSRSTRPAAHWTVRTRSRRRRRHRTRTARELEKPLAAAGSSPPPATAVACPATATGRRLLATPRPFAQKPGKKNPATLNSRVFQVCKRTASTIGRRGLLIGGPDVTYGALFSSLDFI